MNELVFYYFVLLSIMSTVGGLISAMAFFLTSDEDLIRPCGIAAVLLIAYTILTFVVGKHCLTALGH